MLRMRQVATRVRLTLRSYSASTSGGSGSGGIGGSGNEDSGESRKNDNNNKSNQNDKHPIKRTLKLLSNDMQKIKRYFVPNKDKSTTAQNESAVSPEIMKKFKFQGTKGQASDQDFQTHCDVLIIGGGGVGSSIAFWLKEKARSGLNVVVVERDPQYTRASTVLSVGGLRQQFSLAENIQMSLFGADFIREVKQHLGDVDLNFTPHGYLVLASEKGAETLKRNSKLQNELGARNELLTPDRLKAKFPWINTDNIALGCHGLEKEGWFDPWALLMGFKNKAREYGAHFVNGEVTGFEFQNQPDVVIAGQHSTEGSYNGLDRVLVKMHNGETRTIKFAICIIAAGAYSGDVARLAKIGTGEGLLSIPLPVEPRKRYVYVINTQGANCPGIATPLTVDPDGTYFRRDGLGGNYLCGRSPCATAEPSCENLDVDHEYFETDVWPTLANRVPAFESAKVCSSWAGYYEYNVFDENGIIGPHPYYNNLYIATGFSGHGIQQTPAVGRAISELILDGQFRTLDLSRLSYDRLVVDRPVYEVNIV